MAVHFIVRTDVFCLQHKSTILSKQNKIILRGLYSIYFFLYNMITLYCFNCKRRSKFYIYHNFFLFVCFYFKKVENWKVEVLYEGIN